MRRIGQTKPAVLALVIVILALTAAIACSAPAPVSSPTEAGNPKGNATVPADGNAVNTNHPDRIIGDGSPGSCTSKAVVDAVARGGIIKFNCGPKPITIQMTETATIAKTEHMVVLDGSGLVTLSGKGEHRILFSDTCLGKWSTNNCVSQPYPRIVVQNITFRDGFDGAHQATCTANEPQCWYGGVDGGGAIYVEGGQFKVVGSRFIENGCYGFGPDLGGGAIRALAQYRNRPVYVTKDTFTSNKCSNGGALSSIDVNWNVYNSVFTDNRAVGWGANPVSDGSPGGGSGGAIYADGHGYSILICGTAMSDNMAREGGGAVFFVVDSGGGTLTLNRSKLSRNSSGVFENAPGIFDNVNLVARQPIEHDSLVS